MPRFRLLSLKYVDVMLKKLKYLIKDRTPVLQVVSDAFLAYCMRS